ncbi:DUF5828 family protein [Halospeciosus flavus]|uniref:DUF5828 family protein n=1 Tax=Halospeciosus flavus TaxID=3032283 RepID=A0ABD5Z709_9EURY|nr:DUF5828 family protein [Halospeciosus flavus]
MEESISGFKVRGDWGEVVEFGEQVTRALREAGADEDAVAEFDEWRPKSHEQLEEEVSEKTAEQASVGEGAGEKAGKEPDEDLQTAGEHLTESYEKLEEADTDEAVEKWQDSLDYVARAADTAGRKALRKVEDAVYRKVMTQMAPYYFDNELVSANLRRVRSQEEFTLEVNINDDDLKEEVGDRLRDYDDRVDRWHVDTEKVTENVEAVEGVETPDSERDRDESVKSTTN